ncbi:putative F-box domain-containing protein [Helianthus annuus]|nr:putative F-box domain-containing protein [Helianthus annuus]
MNQCVELKEFNWLIHNVLFPANRFNSSNSISSSSSNSVSSDLYDSDQIIVCSTGEFDRIPIDIFIQILKLVGPKEAAKLTVVCKSWRLIVSGNLLWIYFLQNQLDPWD